MLNISSHRHETFWNQIYNEFFKEAEANIWENFLQVEEKPDYAALRSKAKAIYLTKYGHEVFCIDEESNVFVEMALNGEAVEENLIFKDDEELKEWLNKTIELKFRDEKRAV